MALSRIRATLLIHCESKNKQKYQECNNWNYTIKIQFFFIVCVRINLNQRFVRKFFFIFLAGRWYRSVPLIKAGCDMRKNYHITTTLTSGTADLNLVRRSVTRGFMVAVKLKGISNTVCKISGRCYFVVIKFVYTRVIFILKQSER